MLIRTSFFTTTMFSRRLMKTLCYHSNLLKANRSGINRMYSEIESRTNDNLILESKHSSVSQLLDDSANFNEVDDNRWATSPYPDGNALQAKENPTDLQKKNPLDTSIILFPGQSMLQVGKVKDYLKFPEAKYLFEIANEALGYDLLKICLDGPQNVLDRTEHNQPATVLASLAALERLKEERPRAIENCVSVAGYSVGELTALIFSGAMTLEAGIRLVRVRATAMQSAADLVPQGMLYAYCSPESKPGIICDKAKTWALDIGVPDPECRIAIYLYSNAKIFAGNEEALKYIETNGRKMGLRNIKRLPVSGAFHTRLMAPALDIFRKALKTIAIEQPRVPVFSNIDGKPYRTQHQIIKYLPKQIVSPVKWEQTIHTLYARPEGTEFPRTFDVGSGGNIKSIGQKINAKAMDTCYVI